MSCDGVAINVPWRKDQTIIIHLKLLIALRMLRQLCLASAPQHLSLNIDIFHLRLVIAKILGLRPDRLLRQRKIEQTNTCRSQ